MSVIQQAKNDGTLEDYRDFRLGIVDDLSGNGNAGTFNSTPYFNRDGLKLDGVTDRINTYDLTTPPSITLFALVKADSLTHAGGGDFPRLIEKGSSITIYVSSANRVYFITTGISDTSTITAVDTFMPGEFITVVCTYDGSAGVRRIYLDGVLNAEETGLTGTIAVNNNTLFYGNNSSANRSWNGSIKSMGVMSKALSETEVSQLTAELLEQKYPTKPSSKTLANVQPNLQQANPPNAVWNLKPQGSSIIELTGSGNDGTIVGSPTFGKELLGDTAYFDGTDTDLITIADNALLSPSTALTVGCWAKRISGASYDTLINKSYGSVSVGSSQYHLGYDDANKVRFFAGADITGATSINDGDWHLIMGEADASGHKLYVDNVEDASSGTAYNYRTANHPLIIGGREFGGAYSWGMAGFICMPFIYPRLLTSVEKTELYNLGANLVQYKTDWGTKVSTANVTAGYLGDTDWEVSTGTWKITTDTINGNKVKVFENVAAGMLYLPIDKFMTAEDAAYGTLEFQMLKPGTGASNILLSDSIATAGTGNNYNIIYRSDETVDFREGTSTKIDGGSFAADTWHKVKLTRRYDGLFDMIINGTSQGTVTDATTTSINYLILDLDAGGKIAISDKKGNNSIIKKLGV